MAGGWSTPRPCPFTPGNDPTPIVQEVGWAPGPIWTGSEKLAPSGIKSPDRPARSESLHRLRYPGPVIPKFLGNLRPLIHLAVNCLQFYFLELPTPDTHGSELSAILFFWNFRSLIHLTAICLQFYFLELPTPATPGSELSAILFFGTSDPCYTWQRIVCNFIFWNFRPLIHLAPNCLQIYFLELPTTDTPDSKLFAILFSGTSDG